ncbi:hypothetical protein FACS189472_10310 [Alphaproteobacteria bacterium]|nr:hypothetical protein FACS189472_10310 [Alphaproteobacteria bacterium]
MAARNVENVLSNDDNNDFLRIRGRVIDAGLLDDDGDENNSEVDGEWMDDYINNILSDNTEEARDMMANIQPRITVNETVDRQRVNPPSASNPAERSVVNFGNFQLSSDNENEDGLRAAYIDEVPVEELVQLNSRERAELRRQENSRIGDEFITAEEFPDEVERLATHERVNENAGEKGMFIVDENTIVDTEKFEHSIPQPVQIVSEKRTTVRKEEHQVYDLYRFTPTSFRQIAEMITSIFNDKEMGNMGRFKATHDFGIIEEHPSRNEDGSKKAYYKLKPSNYQISYKTASRPFTVANHVSLKFFIDDVITNLTQLPQQAVPKADSSTRYVFVYEVLIVFAHLKPTASAAAVLEPHIAKRYIFNTTDPKYKICWFIALAKHLNPKLKDKSLPAKGRELFLEFKAKEYRKFMKTFKPKKLQHSDNEFMSGYQGFETVSDMDDFLKFVNSFGITSVQTFAVNEMCKKDNLKVEYSYVPDEHFGENDYDGNHTLNVLLVWNEDECHALYVSDPEKLTGCKICPKCHYVSFDTSVKQYQYKYNKHVAECTGEPPEAQVRLAESKPYVPDIQKNPTKFYLLARDRLKEFKYTGYFGCWDLETVEEKLTRDSKTVGTILISKIHARTIATAFHMKKGDVSNYKDIRNGDNFIHQMLEYSFGMAEQVAEDNMYEQNKVAEAIRIEAEKKRKEAKKLEKEIAEMENPELSVKERVMELRKEANDLKKKADEIDIPYNWREVPILGFNSAKFDLNLILPELNCKEWKIMSDGLMIGGVSSFKKIRVKHEKTGIILAFLNARNFVEGGSLAQFVTNFGNGEMSKGMFPYEAFNSTNYMEYLNQTEPSPIEDFRSELNRTGATPENYENVYRKG